MSTHTPNTDPSDHLYHSEGLADHTHSEEDEDKYYHSDNSRTSSCCAFRTPASVSGEENYGFEADLDSGYDVTGDTWHDPEPTRWCQKCDRAFETTEAYELHLKASNKHYICQYCDSLADYHTFARLQSHWQVNHSSVFCKLCYQNFSSPAEKQNHLLYHHSICEPCRIWFLSPHHRRYHWTYSTAHRDTYCKFCNLDFSNHVALDDHMINVHRSEPQDEMGTDNNTGENHYLCKDCMIWFKSQRSRRYHWAFSGAHRHTYCMSCNLYFPNPVAFEAHVINVHRPEPRERLGTGNPDSNENAGPRNSGKYNQEHDLRQESSKGKSRHQNDPGRDNSRRFPKDSRSKDDKKKPSNSKSRGRNTHTTDSGSSKDHRGSSPKDALPPNHYATLGISSTSSAEEIEKAARQKRIETHPDRLKRKPGLSAQELEAIDINAKNIGFAAEVLGDPALRRQYDVVYRQWYSDSW
ncbi:hypothetical protein MMC29_003445 [Sticta canariensis]|nr:hypothetical protein [Sticta canariensis]